MQPFRIRPVADVAAVAELPERIEIPLMIEATVVASSRGGRRTASGYALASLFATVAAAAAWALELFGGGALLVFYPAVLLAAWYGGLGPAVLATSLSGFAASYLFLAPSGSLRIGGVAGAIALSVFLLSGLLLGAIIGALQRRNRHEREARLRAERTAGQAEHLQELTTALSKAVTPAEVTDECVLEATHSLGAAAGAMLQVVNGGPPELVRAVGFPEQSLEAWRQVPLGPDTPFGEAVRTRAVVVSGSRAARRAAYGELAEAQFLAEHEATAVVPLVAHGRVIGLLGLALSDSRTWTPDDREFLEKVSVRAAQALDRAWQYELVERARAEAEDLRARADQELAERQRAEEALRDSEARYRALAARTTRLHGLTAALSEAVTVEAVAQAVVSHAKLVVGAQGGSLALLVDEGARFETLAAADSPEGAEPGARFPVAPGLCLSEAAATRRPVFVTSFAEWQKRFSRSAADAADRGYASTAALPLMVDGVPIGVLGFYFTAPISFDRDYRALLTSVAQHCVQALDRARLYEVEHRAREKAEAANRLKDDFLSTVSHELRTPLNAILGWAAMLRLGTLDRDRAARAIQAIHDNATRQAQLVDDLLDLSRIAAGRVALDLHEFDLGRTILEAVEAILPLAESKGLEVRLGPPVPTLVVADARRLQQVFLNLLSNAVKFTPAGGRIEVQMASTGRTVEIYVSDTGIGIEPEFLPHVFDRFRQADSNTTRTHGGLGLGLAIARHLVERHGGSIRAESAGRGRGATFVITLPLAAPALGMSPVGRSGADDRTWHPDDLPNLSGVRVLVVDDEPDAREMMVSQLSSCGATVTAAASAQEALEALTQSPVDVLLADIGMPNEDGYSLIRQVRMLPSPDRACLPAAAVTAYAGEDQRRQALAAGFQVHLAKPVDPPVLARAVAALVDRAAHSASGPPSAASQA